MARAMCTYQDQDPDRVLESMDRHRQPVIMWTHWKGEADAALSALRQWLADNWLVVVPRDATPTMSHAGESYMETMDDDAYAQDVWHNMIAAAPDVLETKP
jgi:hypothetical protein